MEFKNYLSKKVLIPVMGAVFVIGFLFFKFSVSAGSVTTEDVVNPMPLASIKEIPLKPLNQEMAPDLDFAKEDGAIEEQLERDRQEQKQTKLLKTKLEQTDLELEEQKALAEINKLKMENVGALNDPSVDGAKNIPEIKVQYIGGDSVKKEAIISIAGINYQVKEKSSPLDNVQILSISDSSVTLHFKAPQDLTKTVDYKPE